MRKSPIRIAVGLVLAAIALAGCTPSEQEDSGPDWSKYPAHAYIDADAVRTEFGSAETEARAESILASVREAIEARYGIGGWTIRHNHEWTPFGGNGYGGPSMLTAYTSPVWEAAAEIPQDKWASIIHTVREIAATNGMRERSAEGERQPDWMTLGSYKGKLEYLEVIVQDARLSKEELRLAEMRHLLIAGITLSYGNTTVADEKADEFEKATLPFTGRERPEATTPD